MKMSKLTSVRGEGEGEWLKMQLNLKKITAYTISVVIHKSMRWPFRTIADCIPSFFRK